jgi:hypothetical protein
MHPTSPARRLASAAAALALALPALTVLVPAVGATTVYTDGMETMAGWDVSGSNIGTDCGLRQAGLCSFVVTPQCCSQYSTATRGLGLAMSGVVTVDVWFQMGTPNSESDSGFVIQMDNGGYLTVEPSYGAGWVYLWGSYGWGYYMGSMPTAGAWYRAQVIISPGHHGAEGRLYSASGALLYSTCCVGFATESTRIESVQVYGVTWGSPTDTYHYDSVSMDITGTGPTAPTGVTVQRNGHPRQLQLGWSAPTSTGSDPFEGYNIYRSTSPGGPFQMIVYATSATSYTDTSSSLQDGTRYYYRVGAMTPSGEATATVSERTYGVPGAPQNLVAAPAVGQTTLTWSAPADDGGAAVGYRVYRGFSSGQRELLGATTGTTFTDTTCTFGKSCYYAVTAVNFMGEGAASNEASALGMAAPDADGLAGLATDADSDGYPNADEVAGNSDPTDFRSTPTTDDDCDGKPNAEEADLVSALGVGHPVVTVAGGSVEFDPDTLEASIDPPTVGTHQEGSSSCA